MLGRLNPEQGLAHFRTERTEALHPDAPWAAEERPEIAIDLYDSRLRDHDAVPWPVDVMRNRLRHDPAWRRRVEGQSDIESALEADASALADCAIDEAVH